MQMAIKIYEQELQCLKSKKLINHYCKNKDESYKTYIGICRILKDFCHTNHCIDNMAIKINLLTEWLLDDLLFIQHLQNEGINISDSTEFKYWAQMFAKLFAFEHPCIDE